jgi:1,4-dihydroxy-2-naphthoyl-CoA synthase
VSIDLTVSDGIAVVTINRPERLNAMDPEHYRDLSAAWIRVRDDDEINVAVVTGAGERSTRRRARCSIAGSKCGSPLSPRLTGTVWAAA